ncbi:restriction endonuclease [Marinomonas sp. A79]|uniref:Restriction endonuclease n=1 Tax=Marinomonas vulgaris TaxID=2823372 RepID=A0ABS5HF83_9GAMM|nr:restriction endonuclease [Marinomonas vulgaris]MBR7890134.1 restriction endonuclease [Marinomonas vulgaris]
MAIPDYQTLMLPFLRLLADGAEHQLPEVTESLSLEFQLTEEERNELLPSGNQAIMRNRVGWARAYLKKALLLDAPRRGVFQITDRGREVLADAPEKITARYLRRFEEFCEFQNSASSSEEISTPQNTDENRTPTEAIEVAFNTLNNDLATEVLDSIKKQTPQFFEQLVVQLMQAMGYGGWSKESGRATQFTSDGGIDGIINEDPLGLETIYLQAKRYSDNAIGRPDIQAFVGALEMRRARKGVFITTSRFSKEALEYISMIEKKVVLIDGKQLADLMIKHNLGVTVKQTYQVKDLDTDYFIED